MLRMRETLGLDAAFGSCQGAEQRPTGPQIEFCQSSLL